MSDGPQPGIYENVPFDQYLLWPHISNSGLGGIERSLLHWKYREQIEETDPMRFGTLCHAGQLEPSAIFRNYVVMPDLTKGILTQSGTVAKNPKATAEYESRVAQWEAVHAVGKKVVSQEQWDDLVGVLHSLNANARARDWFTAPGPTEVSIVWDDPDTGVRCKGRLDKLALSIGMIPDLKTTRDCVWFPKQIAERRYYRQAAMYIDGVMTQCGGQVCRFGMVAVENVKPYGVMAAPLRDADVEQGRDEYKSALRSIAAARKNGIYTSYDNPDEWALPAWRAVESETLNLTFNGAKVAL